MINTKYGLKYRILYKKHPIYRFTINKTATFSKMWLFSWGYSVCFTINKSPKMGLFIT